MSRIYVESRDNTGWSVSRDKQEIIKIINSLEDYYHTNQFLFSNIVYNTWWNNSRYLKFNGILKKKILLTCSNFINLSNPEYELKEIFNKVISNYDFQGWVCPSQRQLKILDSNNQKTFYFPFIVDRIYNYLDNSFTKKSICQELGIDYSLLKGKIILSNFMRDSTLVDLNQPKWQKNPELLIEICKNIDKKKYILLLAGPRRHFVIKMCRKLQIPFLYYGIEKKTDDIKINIEKSKILKKLYMLSDIHLVTSKSEGGPKCIPESLLCKRVILSTDVGHSRDYLDDRHVFSNEKEYIKYVKYLVENEGLKSDGVRDALESGHNTAKVLQSDEYLKKQFHNNLNLI